MNAYIIMVLTIAGAYFLYLLFTQPRGAIRILGVIANIIGKVLYAIGVGLYNILRGITNLIFRKKR